MQRSARDTLLETALRLFHRDGFHATGIDRLLAEAGVAKMTLYKHFGTKDGLILAVLRLRDERFRQWLAAETAARATTPAGQLAAIFAALADWISSADFYGCLFINATAEFGAPDHPAKQAAAAHKAMIRDWLAALATQAGAAHPEQLAAALSLLKDGLIVTAQIAGPDSPATRQAVATATGMAETLIRQATPAGS